LYLITGSGRSIRLNVGNVLINNAVNNGVDKLQVNGSARFTDGLRYGYGQRITDGSDLNTVLEAGFYSGQL
jgi:hypothetical protein